MSVIQDIILVMMMMIDYITFLKSSVMQASAVDKEIL